MNTMKIGELSAQSGISASRIRFYEANALLQRTGDDTLALRDQAIFELFYSSGLRLAELDASLQAAGAHPAHATQPPR